MIAAELLAEAMRLQKLIDAARGGMAREGQGSTLALLDLAQHSCQLLVAGLERVAVRS